MMYKIGDCRKLIKDISDESIDLVLTDPPYGFNEFGDWKEKDAVDFWETLMMEVSRVMRKGASFYSFTGWKYYCEARQQISKHIKYLKTLIWDKRTFIGTRGNIATLTFHNISEPIILAYKEGAELTFNLEDVRQPTIHKDPRSNPEGKRPGDIISCIGVRNNAKEKVPHKGQKPLKIIELFVRASSNEGDVVLDPFVGSGTTLVACKKLNRNGIGYEINKEYEWMIKKRLGEIL